MSGGCIDYYNFLLYLVRKLSVRCLSVECTMYNVVLCDEVELLFFIIVYNREVELEVSGGCIGIFIFFFYVKVGCMHAVSGGCTAVR